MTLTAPELLDVWERGAGRHPLDRGLVLLAAARPGSSMRQLADVPVGERDQALLTLRCALFGSRLGARVDCPACSAPLEFSFMERDIRCDPPPSFIDVDGLRVRPPTSRDLAHALARAGADAERALAESCIVRDDDSSRRALTAEEVVRVEMALASADGAAQTLLELSCDACGHVWSMGFNVGAYLWREIEVAARALLLDVHALAGAYGWTEHDVLSLSDRRRGEYIRMIES